MVVTGHSDLETIGVLKSNRVKKQDLVATSRAERGIARHVLVGQASETVSELIAGGVRIAADNPY
jgi:hypothetical protein